MARRAEQYSRLIAWLKILLPLAALSLLSTLFLLARDTEQVLDLPFVDVLNPEGDLQEQVGAPYYTGATPGGDLLTMTASRARPLASGQIKAVDVSATMTTADGNTINLRSDDALLAEDSSEALLRGEVQFTNSDGYVLTTEEMRTALDRIEGESLGPVSGSGPAGTLEAGKMQFDTNPASGGVHLLFTGGVKLVYTPRN